MMVASFREADLSKKLAFAKGLCAAVLSGVLAGCAAVDQASDQLARLVGRHPQLEAMQPVVGKLGFQVGINPDQGGGGRYLLTRAFYKLPLVVTANVDQDPIKKVTVAGIVVPLGPDGKVALDTPTRGALMKAGLTRPQITELETLLNELHAALRKLAV
jgi:hypothetical protein